MEGDPSGDALRARLEPQPGGDASTWRPLIFRASEAEDRRGLGELLDREAGARVRSSIRGQLEELMECRDPRVKNDAAERERRVVAHLDRRPITEYGCWVYFPWSRHLVQVLPEAEFREVRASRNRYKITVEEQARLRSFTIGVVGLSVGQAIAMAMALEGCAGAYRLADFDHLALSNLNRLSCGIADLGLNKAILSARRLLEVDPYLDVRVHADGVTEESVDAFLTEGGRLDLLVEECDDLFMKVYLRERARSLHVPVLMETNDRGMLDIERFDLEPDRDLFHGLVGPVRAQTLKGLPTKEKVPFVLKILGDMSPRLAASLVEIDQTITSWPQLGSGAMLGGAVAADAARRVLLGELRASGRFRVDLHELVRDSEDAVAAGPIEPAPAPPEDRPNAAAAAAVSARPGPVSTEQILHLVSSAVLAPSGGNCQPWRFVWSAEGRLRCLHDVARSASFLDFEHRAAYMALGAAVENVVITAATMGLEAGVVPFPGRDPEHVCDVVFVPRERSEGTGDGLAPFIPVRATNRRLGARRPLAQEELAKLHGALGDPAAELQVLAEPEALEEMGLVLGAGDRFRFFDERLYREMMAEMRWNPRHAEQTRDGVDIATLELGDVDEAGLRLLSSWSVVRFLRSVGIGGALEDLSRHAVEAASAMALVTYGGTSPLDYFLGGRAMQRVWLTATALGLAVQPMSSLPYLFARLERGAGFESRERDVLRGLRERYARLFRVGPQRGELLLFRLARVEAPTVRSLRRPAAAVLSFA